MPPMSIALGILIFFATIAAMEAVAYVAHRWVMHGFGWFLHESHHRVRHGMFELNDLYGVIFALPAIVLTSAASSSAGPHGRLGLARGLPVMVRSISAFTTSSCTSASGRVICRSPNI